MLAPNCAYCELRVVSRAVVFKLSATEPEVPLPESGLVVVMPVISDGFSAVSMGAEIAETSAVLFNPSATEPDVPLPVRGLVVVIPVISEDFRAVTMSGVNVVTSPDVFNPRATEPEVPLPVSGLVVVIPVIVPAPVPGNVCPLANVILPFAAIESPVAAGAAVPAPNSRLRFALGVVVLFPVGTASQRKFCVVAAAGVLVNALALNSRICETAPAFAVAGAMGGSVSIPRTKADPPTSSIPAGAAELMPIPAVPCVIFEFPSVLAAVHSGTVFTVPVPLGVV